MAHFAKLENNFVIDVIVVNNEVLEHKNFPESEAIGVAFCKSLFGENTEWKQTSYNNNFRGKYAGLGDFYNSETDQFEREPVIPPQEEVVTE